MHEKLAQVSSTLGKRIMESAFDGSELPKMYPKRVTTHQIPSDLQAAHGGVGGGSGVVGATTATGNPGSSLFESVSFPIVSWSRKAGKHRDWRSPTTVSSQVREAEPRPLSTLDYCCALSSPRGNPGKAVI